jgi:hypothetical protein
MDKKVVEIKPEGRGKGGEVQAEMAARCKE